MILSLFLVVAAAAAAARGLPQAKNPTVTTSLGSFLGTSIGRSGVEAFLGIPYAQPPTGSLRFRHPHAIDKAWSTAKDASTYGPSCPGYAGFSANMTLDEDCLTLNVVRPQNTDANASLPVLVWIYGGGFTGGGTSDPRYDLTNLVSASAAIGKPIIAASMNYRLGSWGFLAAKELSEFNFGLYDQRLALHWIQDNIAAFGGNKSKVTIWGESAGAFSVGFHTVAFDGQNQDLFRAAIFESGTALAPGIEPAFSDKYQAFYDNITRTANCSRAADTLECLRQAPYEVVFNASAPFIFTPVVDGALIPRLPSESFALGLVANISILVGSNTDEGTASFWGPRNTLNTDANVRAYISSLGMGLPTCIVDTLMKLYPDDPTKGCPFDTGTERFADQGYQYKRGAAIAGDWAIHAGRRQTAEDHAAWNNGTKRTVYVYRFDQPPWDNKETLIATIAPVYSTHYSEIGFAFNNSNPELTTWIGTNQSFHKLSGFMSRSWISFAHSLDPNGHGVSDAPHWPDYRFNESLMVFRAGSSHTETDTWRVPQLRFWSTIWRLLKT